MKNNTVISSLLEKYNVSIFDLYHVGSVLDTAEAYSVYFSRHGNVYRTTNLNLHHTAYIRGCASSKNPYDIRVKLYLPARVMDEYINDGIAEFIASEAEFFAKYEALNKGLSYERCEVENTADYWMDETGTILSSQKEYTFEVLKYRSA